MSNLEEVYLGTANGDPSIPELINPDPWPNPRFPTLDGVGPRGNPLVGGVFGLRLRIWQFEGLMRSLLRSK